MVRVLANNANYNMTITPRDSGGQPITGLGNINATRWIVTDGTNNFTINSSTLLSDGVTDRYALNVTPVGVPSGVKNVSIRLDGVTVATAPTPLQYDFRPGYSGRFDTTGAEMAWDCTLYNGTTSTLYDAAGNSNIAQKYVGGNYRNDLFTASSQYKTSSTGDLITLGQAKVSATLTELTTNLQTGFSCGLYDSGKQPEYCNGIDYTNGLPLKTIVGVYYRSVGTTIREGLGCQYVWSKDGGTGNEGFGVSLNETTVEPLTLYARTGALTAPVCIFDNAIPGQLWNYAGGIALIAVRIDSIDNTGLASFTMFLNRNKTTGTYQFGTSSASDSALKKGINALGSSFGTSLTSTTNFLSCFDFAAYNDVKSDAFIFSLCSAWGL